MGGIKVTHYADFGSSEPWVARTILGLPDLVNVVPAFAAGRDEFALQLGDTLQPLGMAFEEFLTLRERAPKPGPQLAILRTYTNLYSYLWQAYKDRFPRALKALGIDIGFAFQKETTSDAKAKALVAQRPELTDLVTCVQGDRGTFRDELAWCRNEVVEHRSEEPDAHRVASFHRLDSAETMFENVWQAIEDYTVLAVIANLPPALQVAEIPAPDRDPAVPKRFGLALVGGLPKSPGDEATPGPSSRA